MGATETNMRTLFAELKEQRKYNQTQSDRIHSLENELATLRAEVQNSKQLMGHLMGRGMGSTVHTAGE